MRILGSILFLAVLNVVSSGVTWAADAPIFGTFALFEVDEHWGNLSVEERQKGGEEAKALLEGFKGQVTVDGYWTYGLTTESHFMLRLHSADLKANQQLLTHIRGTSLGRHLDLEYTISGVTKKLNYAPDFPELLEKLKAAKYEGDPST
ncbi:MAG: chlorite dismutase family protein [Nitrospirales bacterium]|nr:chlorite dismutase family protein [Nitrospirales bacterium]